VTLHPALIRFGAPTAFLAAATAAILLIRSGVADDQPALRERPAAAVAAQAAARPRPATTTRRRATAPREEYEIRAGDTLGMVADRYDTTVEALVELNPGIDPTALQVGQRIRVK
jgi:LysM repeat protein